MAKTLLWLDDGSARYGLLVSLHSSSPVEFTLFLSTCTLAASKLSYVTKNDPIGIHCDSAVTCRVTKCKETRTREESTEYI